MNLVRPRLPDEPAHDGSSDYRISPCRGITKIEKQLVSLGNVTQRFIEFSYCQLVAEAVVKPDDRPLTHGANFQCLLGSRLDVIKRHQGHLPQFARDTLHGKPPQAIAPSRQQNACGIIR